SSRKPGFCGAGDLFLERTAEDFARQCGGGIRGQRNAAEDDADPSQVEIARAGIAKCLSASVKSKVKQGVQTLEQVPVNGQSFRVETEILDEVATAAVNPVRGPDLWIERIVWCEQPSPGGH